MCCKKTKFRRLVAHRANNTLSAAAVVASCRIHDTIRMRVQSSPNVTRCTKCRIPTNWRAPAVRPLVVTPRANNTLSAAAVVASCRIHDTMRLRAQSSPNVTRCTKCRIPTNWRAPAVRPLVVTPRANNTLSAAAVVASGRIHDTMRLRAQSSPNVTRCTKCRIPTIWRAPAVRPLVVTPRANNTLSAAVVVARRELLQEAAHRQRKPRDIRR
jgi:type IV secretory pathway VirB3-like protein